MPSRRFALYAVLIASLILGILLGHPMFFHLAYFAFGVLVVSLLWTWGGVIWVRLERHPHSRRGQVGRTLEETLALRNLSFLPRLWLEVRDHSTLPGHRASRVLVNLTPRGRQEWQVQTPCTRRGWYRLGPVTLLSGDPFGFFEAQRRLAASMDILIYPATVPLRGFAPSMGRLPGGEALRHPAHFVTPNASGVRDYLPGDSLSRIHWLSTARRNRLTVKEFEIDPLADIWIVLDNDGQVHPPAIIPEFSTEEYGVTIAASLAQYFLQSDRSVGFLTYAPDREWLQADRGPRQLIKILELLAITQASSALTLGEVLTLEGERFARATTALLITPSLGPAWIDQVRRLVQRGVRVVVVHVAPESFGGPLGAEEIVTILRAEGALVYPVCQEDDLSLVLSGAPTKNRNPRSARPL